MLRFLNFKILIFCGVIFLAQAAEPDSATNVTKEKARIESVMLDLVNAMEAGKPSRILEQQDYYEFEYLIKKSKIHSVSYQSSLNEYSVGIEFEVVGERRGAPKNVKQVIYPKPEKRIEYVKMKPGTHAWVFSRQLSTPFRKK